jgi:hypothetical protein
MSLSSSHDQAATAVNSVTHSETHSPLVERAVAIGFGAAASTAMVGWLYVLASALWDGIIWLFW